MTQITPEEKTKRGIKIAELLGLNRSEVTHGLYHPPGFKHRISAAEIFDLVHEVCCKHHEGRPE